MNWQKARIIKADFPEWLGREIWTETHAPILAQVNHRYVAESVVVNLIPNEPFYDRCGLQPDQLELLPEFKDDVPMLTIEEFLAQPKEQKR